MHQAGREKASGTTGKECRGNLALWGGRGRESHMDLCTRMRWCLEPMRREVEESHNWDCGRSERERKREVDLTGNIKAPSFPIQLLAAYTVQN